MKRFSLIGAAGYIAPRHMAAIRDTGNTLVSALDPNDSVGIIDSFFPEADFFTEFEQFDRDMDNRRRAGEAIDYVSICSPNYLHDSHMRFALRSGADAICEKPLVLNPQDIGPLQEIEKETGRRIHTILQLRLHPAILKLRDSVATMPMNLKADVDLTYITSRGNWYLKSWKGMTNYSGGIATNIGVHFFDMLHFVFGEVQENVVHLSTPTTAAGYLEYDRARVRWFLSLDVNDVPAEIRATGKRTFRSLTADGENVEFSDGFTELHTRIYEAVLAGGGFGVAENKVAIETVAYIRDAPIARGGDLIHPFAKRRL